MKWIKSSFIIMFLVCAVSSAALAKEINFKGQAFMGKSKENLVYREAHLVTYKGEQILTSSTTYFNPKGERIAVLKCNYWKHRFFPEFEFTDFRTGYWEKMQYANEEVVVQYKETADTKAITKRFQKAKDLSASQGLNQVIVANLKSLAEGKNIITQFILPSRLAQVEMLMIGKDINNDKLQVSIKLNNLLLRFFAPKIEIIYNMRTSQLLTYYGNSNILTDKGDKQKVYIEYEYSDTQKVVANGK